jgi:signal transduction histidine kinase
MPDSRRTPSWLWPNLLSLDAPIVALAWLFMFEKTWRMYLPWHSFAALGLSVWAIYVWDRILDLKLLGAGDEKLGARHEFHRRCLPWAGWLALLAIIAAGVLAGFFMPAEIIHYGKIVLVMMVAFFVLTVFALQDREIPVVRNIFAGVIFGYGTAMAAHVYVPLYETQRGPWELFRAPEMLAFAFLCVLNISAIHFWEHSRRTSDEERRAQNDLSVTIPLTVLATFCLLFALRDPDSTTRPFFYAILTASALLYVLNRQRERFSTDALRVLADLAMVAPLPVFFALSAG